MFWGKFWDGVGIAWGWFGDNFGKGFALIVHITIENYDFVENSVFPR